MKSVAARLRAYLCAIKRHRRWWHANHSVHLMYLGAAAATLHDVAAIAAACVAVLVLIDLAAGPGCDD